MAISSAGLLTGCAMNDTGRVSSSDYDNTARPAGSRIDSTNGYPANGDPVGKTGTSTDVTR